MNTQDNVLKFQQFFQSLPYNITRTPLRNLTIYIFV